MAENSKIEWTDHTFNPWEGCMKVSAGCANCYAEDRAKRFGTVEWGATAKRRRTSAANWKKPLKWNREAGKLGIRYRVFCASLADVFEIKKDQPEMDEWRMELFDLIDQTPNLDWLLLTKRPENIELIWHGEHISGIHYADPDRFATWPKNIWIGTSVENQEQADKRIPELLKIPAVVRFLSMEPLLGPVDLSDLAYEVAGAEWAVHNALIDWIIVGGESGPNARPMRPIWARSIRDQCKIMGIPFLFKQWGEWLFESEIQDINLINGPKFGLGKCEPNGQGIMGLQSAHRIHTNGGFNYYKVGKKVAGRLLDGRTWDEFPI